MVGARVTGEEAVDFDKALHGLTNLLMQEELEECTPIFYISSKINGVLYTDILVGVRASWWKILRLLSGFFGWHKRKLEKMLLFGYNDERWIKW